MKSIVKSPIRKQDLINLVREGNTNLYFHRVRKIPLFEKALEIKQGPYHNFEDVLTHSIRTLEEIKLLTEKPLLRIAGLFHDVGKISTCKIINGNPTFWKHDVVGSIETYKYLKSIGFSINECKYVGKLIRWHQFRFYKDTKDKVIKKWLIRVGPNNWKDLLTLRIADRRGNIATQNKTVIYKKLADLIERVERISNEKI